MHFLFEPVRVYRDFFEPGPGRDFFFAPGPGRDFFFAPGPGRDFYFAPDPGWFWSSLQPYYQVSNFCTLILIFVLASVTIVCNDVVKYF